MDELHSESITTWSSCLPKKKGGSSVKSKVFPCLQQYELRKTQNREISTFFWICSQWDPRSICPSYPIFHSNLCHIIKHDYSPAFSIQINTFWIKFLSRIKTHKPKCRVYSYSECVLKYALRCYLVEMLYLDLKLCLILNA